MLSDAEIRVRPLASRDPFAGSLSAEIEISWKIKGKREEHHKERLCVWFVFSLSSRYLMVPLSLRSGMICSFLFSS